MSFLSTTSQCIYSDSRSIEWCQVFQSCSFCRGIHQESLFWFCLIESAPSSLFWSTRFGSFTALRSLEPPFRYFSLLACPASAQWVDWIGSKGPFCCRNRERFFCFESKLKFLKLSLGDPRPWKSDFPKDFGCAGFQDPCLFEWHLELFGLPLFWS